MSPTATWAGINRPLSAYRTSPTAARPHGRHALNQRLSYPHTETVVHRPVDNTALSDSGSS